MNDCMNDCVFGKKSFIILHRQFFCQEKMKILWKNERKKIKKVEKRNILKSQFSDITTKRPNTPEALPKW